MDRIEDPQNRHLAISRRYADAKQKPGQKTSDFANFLASLERDLEEMSERMRRDNLLNKMQKELYERVIASHQIPETREALIALATRLEVQISIVTKTQEKSYARTASAERSSWKPKTSYAKSATLEAERSSDASFSEGDADEKPTEIICYKCHKKGHVQRDCRNKKA